MISRTPPAAAYFDAIRIAATLAVALHHLSPQRLTGGLGWQLGHIGPSRVVLFLALSGFLVAASQDRPSATPRRFAVARLSRLASVALPALALTAALDALGAALDPALYANLAAPGSAVWLEQYARALTLSTMGWSSVGSPGSNWAWWTLGVEAACWLVFGLLVFACGWARVIGIALTLLAAGPVAAVLAPAWLIGAGAYHLAARRPLTGRQALALTLAPPLAWLAWELTRLGHPTTPRGLPQDNLPLTYATAAGVALHLAGACVLAPHLPAVPRQLATALRWTAGATFTLYLLHMPLSRALAAASPWEPASWSNRALVIGGVLLATLALAEVTERRRGWWRRMLEGAFADAPRIVPNRSKEITHA